MVTSDKKLMPHNASKREQKINEMQNLLDALAKDTNDLKSYNAALVKIDQRIATIQEYYYTEWAADHKHYSGQPQYDVLSQDAIYNTLQEIHKEKIKLLKQLVNSLS